VRIAADVLAHEEPLGIALAREAHHLRDDVAAPDDERRAAVAQRAVEVPEALKQEGQPVRRPRAAADEPIVDHEGRHDAIRVARRRPQRQVVVQAEVAGEEDDRRLHPAQASGGGDSVARGLLALGAALEAAGLSE
jgi:hypothetical protein